MQRNFVILAIVAMALFTIVMLEAERAIDSALEKPRPIPVWDCVTDIECETALARWERSR